MDGDLTITAEGLVPPCCLDYNFEICNGPVGNAYNTPLIDIWNSKKRSDLHEWLKNSFDNQLPNPCQNCSVLFSDLSKHPLVDDLDRFLELRKNGAGYFWPF
jgi:radical SAM protein with 4Fe4S-binding SPASM domain